MSYKFLHISGYECFDLQLHFWVISDLGSPDQLLFEDLVPYYRPQDSGYKRYLTEHLQGENVVVKRVDYLRASGPIGKLL